MSGNPFRRNAPGVKLQAEEKKIERTPSPFKIGKKEKRVKIQTPPQSPEEPPRRLSAGRVSPPPPERTSSDDDDGSDTTATADSDIENAARNTRRNSGSLPPPGTGIAEGNSVVQSPATTPGPGAGGAPYNPFARTLATNEAAFGLQKSRDGKDDAVQTRQEGAKKGMDVDMFKNILMTGSPAPTPPQQTQHQPQQDSSSNTDTSSVSKHSLFDQSYNLHPESPRSSFDHVQYSDEDEADDEKGGLMGGKKERLDDFAPPAPPKPGQTAAKPARGPQTVSFADFNDFSPVEDRSNSPENAALARRHIPPALHRTSSDLNKPLPKTPPRSPGLPLETPLSMDTQVAQNAQTPQPPTPTVTSPDDAAKKAPPPPPPTSRRAGQTTSTSHTRARSTSDTTAQDTPQEPSSPPESTTPKSTAPPPPPPSRKSKPTSHAPSSAVSTPASEVPPTSVAAPAETESKGMAPPPPPAPAPRRNPSTKTGSSSVHRSPSNASSHASSLRHEAHNNSAAPPAPPPRRALGSKRESLDGTAGNTGAWQHRRSSQNSFESARSGSLSKARLPSESEETAETAEGKGASQPSKNDDILADMSAFQAEIDALRRQTEKGG